MKNYLKRGMSTLVALLTGFIVLCISFAMQSCTADESFEDAYVPEKVYKTIYVHDTVFVARVDTIVETRDSIRIEYREVPVEVHDTLYTIITEHDTIRTTLRDTVTITETILQEIETVVHDTVYQYVPVEVQVEVHDTIFLEKQVIVEKEVIKHDTVNVVVHDTIYVYVEAPTPSPVLPDTPEEWGEIDWSKTQRYGGISWTFLDPKQPILNASVITSRGIVSFNNGLAYFYHYDTSKLTARLSAVPSKETWIPAYITVKDNPNIFWEYKSLEGKVYAMNGVDILKTIDVNLDQPFMKTGKEYSYDQATGKLTIRYTYTDRSDREQTITLFDGVFRK